MNIKVDSATYNTMRLFKSAVWECIHDRNVTNGYLASDKYTICNAVASSFVVPSVTVSTIKIVESIIWKNPDYRIDELLMLSLYVRKLLIHAFDLTLILLRAFHKCTHRCVGPPLMKDIKEASFAYRELSVEVHRSIKDLLPVSHIFESFLFKMIEIGYRGLLQKYIKIFVES